MSDGLSFTAPVCTNLSLIGSTDTGEHFVSRVRSLYRIPGDISLVILKLDTLNDSKLPARSVGEPLTDAQKRGLVDFLIMLQQA